MSPGGGRSLGPAGVAVLSGCAVVGALLLWATDREYMITHGRPAHRMKQASHLPDWVREKRPIAIRAMLDGTALLATMAVGLSVVVLWPRPDSRRAGRHGPGGIAAVMTGGLSLACAICWVLNLSLERHSPPPGTPAGVVFPLGLYVDFYTLWQILRAQANWMTLGAWSTLLITGRWRRATGDVDRLGLCLGAGWLFLGLIKGAISVLAWF
jgi:hypothetical protein